MHLSAALLALAAPLAAAVTPLEVNGRYFVNPSTGNRFQIVGMDYQPGGSAGYTTDGHDPLSDPDACRRDAAIMQVLGVNTVRIYNLNPNLNHDECASIFNAAGMYLILDVNSPLVGEALTSFEPWTSYYDTYLNRTFAIVEAFKDYPNTLLFFSGNEVIDTVDSAEFGPRYVRAVTRDLKNYIKKHSDRYIPVGYSAADVRDVLFDSWNYFSCSIDGEEDDESRADVFGLNSYSWCGDATFKSSTYEDLVEGFAESSVPIFFSEFGCNEVTPRLFTEIATIYSDQMTGVFSGGMVYEYTMEKNNYGVVELDKDGNAVLLSDFDTLATQYADLDWESINSQKPGNTPAAPKCSTKLITTKGFDTNFTIPAMPADDSEKILNKGVSPAPKGKIIDVSDFTIKHTITDASGNQVQNLAVKPVEEANVPGNNDGVSFTAGSSGNGTSAKAGEDKEDAGSFLKPALLTLAVPALAMLL
ncbi:probable beta (1-3) glucanosyltransferase [Cephalotrichum gorgonifer]|uniref:1,3-beta-glucanosyltransferase n=1 Tax=Cephalotrichum gorgonifer TaxID=2041049 RepID=A0AAE8N1V4_9PEZI|nr:probable beta (1-3) glucanosyltransferase [Cephalotrichum gorgonifer]